MARRSKSDLIIDYIDTVLNTCYQAQIKGDMTELEVKAVVKSMVQLARLIAPESIARLSGHMNMYD